MKKKQYIKPEFKAYQVNTTEVICTSPQSQTRITLFGNDETVQGVQDNTIQCESTSYRTTLWE